eukprot:1159906-Pelagomonas_calceolata.AAC.1
MPTQSNIIVCARVVRVEVQALSIKVVRVWAKVGWTKRVEGRQEAIRPYRERCVGHGEQRWQCMRLGVAGAEQAQQPATGG